MNEIHYQPTWENKSKAKLCYKTTPGVNFKAEKCTIVLFVVWENPLLDKKLRKRSREKLQNAKKRKRNAKAKDSDSLSLKCEKVKEKR